MCGAAQEKRVQKQIKSMCDKTFGKSDESPCDEELSIFLALLCGIKEGKYRESSLEYLYNYNINEIAAYYKNTKPANGIFSRTRLEWLRFNVLGRRDSL